MILCVVDTNVILAVPFKNKKKQQLTLTYLSIKKGLNKRGHKINMHTLDNEASELHTDTIEEEQCTYQLVPPDVHHRNAAERATRTFKEHFLRILASVAPKYPMSMWDHLIPQTVITLIHLRQSHVHPHLSA